MSLIEALSEETETSMAGGDMEENGSLSEGDESMSKDSAAYKLSLFGHTIAVTLFFASIAF